MSQQDIIVFHKRGADIIVIIDFKKNTQSVISLPTHFGGKLTSLFVVGLHTFVIQDNKGHLYHCHWKVEQNQLVITPSNSGNEKNYLFMSSYGPSIFSNESNTFAEEFSLKILPHIDIKSYIRLPHLRKMTTYSCFLKRYLEIYEFSMNFLQELIKF